MDMANVIRNQFHNVRYVYINKIRVTFKRTLNAYIDRTLQILENR